MKPASMRNHARPISSSSNGLLAARSIIVGASRMLFMSLPTAVAAPLKLALLGHLDDDVPEAEGASLWVLYVFSMALVLLGGAFAGLTIALMGQDGIYLQVVAKDPTEPQQKNAKRVYDLLQKGKHWVLVTLLLSNVIVNESLPVVLDRCLGGGVAAVVGSTFLIVVFGEIIPQSLCVRYGLQIGGYMSKPVLGLMYLTAPLAYPTAKLLDYLLGEDHGTIYKKSGLKTLVTLHKNLGEVSERLNQDEVTIISAVLDLKEKPVANVMTPMDDVFTMSEDTVLDEQTMDMILSAGYSRIPIHETGNPTNFVGMLLVKILITYDPEDAKLVKDFPLATLPETRPETSCLDIVNFFQEGKSHMVLVSEHPGEDHGALGVVTLEDVIEELIGEEIIDESDVYIDVHKAIRRLTPAPKARVHRQMSEDQAFRAAGGSTIGVNLANAASINPETQSVIVESGGEAAVLSSSPKMTTFMMRRSSAGIDGQTVKTTVPVRANLDDIRAHLKHLGPSNPATNPKNTRSTTVKVKPGTVLAHGSGPQPPVRSASVIEESHVNLLDDDDNETTSLLRSQVTGKDGIQALRQSYGSASPNLTVQFTTPPPAISESGKETTNGSAPNIDSPAASTAPILVFEPVAEQASKATQTTSTSQNIIGSLSSRTRLSSTEIPPPVGTSPRESATMPIIGGKNSSGSNSASDSSIHALSTNDRVRTDSLYAKRGIVRSGSITENIIESRGVRKVVLETTSSNDEDEYAVTISQAPGSSSSQKGSGQSQSAASGFKDSILTITGVGNGKHKDKKNEEDSEESSPLLKNKDKDHGTDGQHDHDVDEEAILSPDDGEDDGEEERPGTAISTNPSQHDGAGDGAGAAPGGSSNAGASGGGGKKKNRRKKRKGGKS
ncbi:protein MAM3 [Naviculisporaceae sp. PSN 640]